MRLYYDAEIARFGAQVNFRSFYETLRIPGAPIQFQKSTLRVRNWARAIFRHFEELPKASGVPGLVDAESLGVLNIKCPAPTHHEMLEARLQLHAWARENLPPSRAAELIALDDLN